MAGLKRRWQDARDAGIPAITLGELLARHVDVFCWCNRCAHHAILDSGMLAAQLGPDFPVPEIGSRMRCSGCHTRDIATRPNWPSLGLVARHD